MGSNVVISGQRRCLTVTSTCDLGVMCHLSLIPLHAITAKGWHSPTGSHIQQVPSSYNSNIISCTFVARVLRPAGRSVLERVIIFRTRKTLPYRSHPRTCSFTIQCARISALTSALHSTFHAWDREFLQAASLTRALSAGGSSASTSPCNQPSVRVHTMNLHLAVTCPRDDLEHCSPPTCLGLGNPAVIEDLKRQLFGLPSRASPLSAP